MCQMPEEKVEGRTDDEHARVGMVVQGELQSMDHEACSMPVVGGLKRGPEIQGGRGGASLERNEECLPPRSICELREAPSLTW